MKKIEAVITCHDMFGIQFEIRTEEEKLVARILRDIVLSCIMTSKAYQLSKAAGAFLQSYSDNFIMIEFWKDEGGQGFIDYINEEIPKILEAHREIENYRIDRLL